MTLEFIDYRAAKNMMIKWQNNIWKMKITLKTKTHKNQKNFD